MKFLECFEKSETLAILNVGFWHGSNYQELKCQLFHIKGTHLALLNTVPTRLYCLFHLAHFTYRITCLTSVAV